MKIRITLEVDDEDRRAIAHFYGDTGKASRETVKTAHASLWDAYLDDVRGDLAAALNETRTEGEG